MKYLTFAVVIFYVFTFPLFTWAEGLPDGADLFIEAVRCRSRNHTLVHSLSYATEQVYRTFVLSKDEVDGKVEEHMTLLHEELKNNLNTHYWLDENEGAVREYYMKTEFLPQLLPWHDKLSFKKVSILKDIV